ncbi:branched-chain amino acid transport system II carrier protein [Shewanella submarina]|uniref:Branched-chain amino acid transport system carrier protein n=1 Tax=Shewanella submarina TaxID=2016376 RepID=A0ABV7GIQ9_9GAMM|nr:branched-chain amino acid transport system II carrier protein [Shewanella submarina]MCL1035837.1 branched-chain amino acid transport system II carrier protein [Shewanella submarina]
MNRRELAAIGFMTFALFLGAGNLIFPPLMAQQAGDNWLLAVAGFLVTAVGLPAITLLILARLPSVEHLTLGLPKWMDRSFWLLIFTTIGPAFALPRAVTVAYEMGVKPFYSGDGLLLFSVFFCVLTLVLALRPGKLVDYIGKVMTPALIIMLCALTLFALFNPLGSASEATGPYQSAPVVSGLTQGYMTLDALAAVVFGWVIINAIRRTDKKSTNGRRNTLTRSTLVIVGIYAILMSACYLAMGYLGATSSNIAPNAGNGGEILAAYAAGQFGMMGQVILALITLIACLTTTVGITTANAHYYENTYGVKFALSTGIICGLTATISNIGLEALIQLSLPVILVLCPVAISLVMAVIVIPAKSGVQGAPAISKGQTLVVSVAALFGTLDALMILGKLPEDAIELGQSMLPLFNENLSWLVPAVITLMLLKLVRLLNTSKRNSIAELQQ